MPIRFPRANFGQTNSPKWMMETDEMVVEHTEPKRLSISDEYGENLEGSSLLATALGLQSWYLSHR